MAPEGVFDVERRGMKVLADGGHLWWRNKQKYRVRIDEPADQPGAGDAVDLRPRAGDPDGAAVRIARRQLRHRHQRKARSLPTFKAAFQRLGRCIEVSKPCSSAL